MIYYCSYYDTDDNKVQQREYSLAAVTKMDSICQTLIRQGYQVEIVSLSGTYGNRVHWGKRYKSKQGFYVKLFTVFPPKSRLIGMLSYLFSSIQMFLYLLIKMKEEDVLIVYHSRFYMKLLKSVKRIKGTRMIIEVEEIYGDVYDDSELTTAELEYFRIADAYIFPTKTLRQKINVRNKPNVIIHGTYSIEKLRNSVFEDDKIHVVYAGTLDPRKGVLFAVSAAEYLDEKYHVHILGFGSEDEKEEVYNRINILKERTKCQLSYDGILSGEDYICFLQSCHIGLSPQDPTALFNTTSFPSKILSYMSNGLRVVSVRIDAVEKSYVGDLITYYEDQTPESIAKAIKSVDFSKEYDSRKRIVDLNVKFERELNHLISEI